MNTVLQCIEPYIVDRKTRCRLRATCKEATYCIQKPKSLSHLATKLKFYRVPIFNRKYAMLEYFTKITRIVLHSDNKNVKIHDLLHLTRVYLNNVKYKGYFKSTMEHVVSKMGTEHKLIKRLCAYLEPHYSVGAQIL